ncbi:MAG: phospholipid carrier-dependent glycosyltransferase [Parcubacteria group bacterium]|jgi:dolichyl-phosphate-mannose-protein mannosyltransferase
MKSKYFFFILAISLFSHLLFFSQPKEVVFDESFFGDFSQDYLKGEYFFDIHPPLGKMLIAGTAKLMGYDHYHSYGFGSNEYETNDYLFLRLLPLIAGIFLGPLLYLVAKAMNFSERASFLVGFFISCDNALIMQSRFILLDALLLFFGFLGVLYFLKYKKDFSARHLAIAGFFASCAVSIKWTGLGFLGIIIFFYLLTLVKSGKRKVNLPGGILSLVVIPIVFYFFVFALHFWLLDKTGPGDYMNTPEFQKTLIGSGYENDPDIKPLGYFGKFIEENSLMYSVNEKTTNVHAYSSKWYSWPFLGKPILYWMSSAEKGNVEMFLVGNPVVWWSSFLAVLITLWLFFAKVISKLKNIWKNQLKWNLSFLRSEFVPLFILTGFLVNWVSFVFIHRFMLVYHYFPALVFSILALGYVIDKITNNKRILFCLYFEAILFFLILFPLTYGVPLF